MTLKKLLYLRINRNRRAARKVKRVFNIRSAVHVPALCKALRRAVWSLEGYDAKVGLREVARILSGEEGQS